jgi:hypothetical protein
LFFLEKTRRNAIESGQWDDLPIFDTIFDDLQASRVTRTARQEVQKKLDEITSLRAYKAKRRSLYQKRYQRHERDSCAQKRARAQWLDEMDESEKTILKEKWDPVLSDLTQSRDDALVRSPDIERRTLFRSRRPASQSNSPVRRSPPSPKAQELRYRAKRFVAGREYDAARDALKLADEVELLDRDEQLRRAHRLEYADSERLAKRQRDRRGVFWEAKSTPRAREYSARVARADTHLKWLDEAKAALEHRGKP